MNEWTRLERPARGVAKPLFADHRKSFLIDAIVEGHHGDVFVDDASTPHVARLEYADIVVLGGDPLHASAHDLVATIPVDKAILPSPDGWDGLMRGVLGEDLVEVTRYGFSDRSLHTDHLLQLAERIPPRTEVRRIDLDLARTIAADGSLISEDHVRNFDSPEDFVERGIGFCALREGHVIAGASSYAVCDSGIEIQVNTHPDHRGKGLATCVCAALVVWCQTEGLAAHWDAGNEISVRLATRLGYTPTGAYTVHVRVAWRAA